MTRMTRRAFVRSIALLPLVAACAPAAPAPAPKETAGAAPKQAAGAAPKAAAGAPQASGPSEWVVGHPEEDPSLDPASVLTGATAGAQRHIFDCLVSHYGADFKVLPSLAESWTLPDPETWVFNLRKGIKFHNGDDFTVDDVIYSFDQYTRDDSPQKARFDQIDKYEAIDSHTFRIKTKGPSATLLADQSGTALILPSKAREKAGPDAFAANPVGTGAYRFVELVRGQHVALEANPDWWWGGEPFPKKLKLRKIPDPSTRVAELKAGGVHIIASPPVPQLKEIDQGDTEVVPLKGGRLIMHQFNTTRKPFDDVRVRQAVNYAVNRDAIINEVLEGYGVPAHGPFTPGWLGYDPDLKPYPYDPAKAKQLLTEAGYPNGLETTWSITTGVFLHDRDVAEAVASQLGQVGIKVRLVPTERAKLQQDWIGGVFEGITSTAWATTVDPGPMMTWAYYKRKGHAPDDKLNSLVEKSQVTVDPAQREQVLKEFGRHVHDQAYLLFLYAVNEFYAKRRDVPWQISAYGQSFSVMRYYRLPVS